MSWYLDDIDLNVARVRCVSNMDENGYVKVGKIYNVYRSDAPAQIAVHGCMIIPSCRFTPYNPVTTITVNQWRIKSNAENNEREPVLCINTYEYESFGKFGPKIGETQHVDVTSEYDNVIVKYDPVNKTPCGASAWMQINHG